MAKIISVANQKGGVGKTTTSVNLSAALGQKNKRTLLIDIDPQGNATSGVGVDRRNVKLTSYDILINQTKAEDVIIRTSFKNLDIIPSSMDLAAADMELIDCEQRESRLKNAILPICSNYDYIIIDCPPSLGLITTNALCFSHTLLIPIQCEYYALEGLTQLIATLRRVKRQYNNSLELEGILFTMYDGRLNLTQQVIEEVKKFLPGKVLNAMIPRGVRISEAPSFGKPVIYFDKNCKGSQAYRALAREILKNNK